MPFSIQQYFYIKVEVIMNIQHYVPMLSLDKPIHSLFRFSPFLSSTISLHELCRITSLMVCFRGRRTFILCVKAFPYGKSYSRSWMYLLSQIRKNSLRIIYYVSVIMSDDQIGDVTNCIYVSAIKL